MDVKCTRLDINEDILTKNLLITNEEPPDELSTLFPAQDFEKSAITLKPSQGFCVKTKDVQTQKKVFINICKSSSIPCPEDISTDELLSILKSDDPSNFKVPMSIGAPHIEKDKSGEDCTAYDIVINTDFFTKIDENPIFHNFFMTATLEGLDDKYNLSLDKEVCTILKNKKYHGSMVDQTIRTTIPLVQELSDVRQWDPHSTPGSNPSVENQNKPLISEIQSTRVEERKKLKPNFVITKINTPDAIEKLQFKINLPELMNGKNVKVEVGGDRVVMETEKHFLDAFVPFDLKNKESKAFFNTTLKVLFIYIPVVVAE